MTSVLADLALESEAATATAMRLARAHEADADEQEQAFRRLATPVSKYWVCKRGPHHAYEAMECLGGNGYTEDFPLARRYREAARARDLGGLRQRHRARRAARASPATPG